MKTQKIKLNQLKPANYNPRWISSRDLKKLKRNLNEFGLVDPILINIKNNHIIGGHQRYYALNEIYPPDTELDLIILGDIGWVFFDTNLEISNENYEKALNISLNKLSGEWDIEKLGMLLEDIEDSDITTDLTGFQPSELDLYNSDDDEFFDSDLFDMDKVYPAPNPTTCPKCKHSFYP